MIVLCVAPVAIYFLTLGLVNSHARPWMVSSRSDFVSLTVVLIPLLIWPLPALAYGRQWWLLIAAAVAVALMFRRMLPDRRAGYVVYNIAENRCRSLVADAIASLGLRGEWTGTTWRSADGRWAIVLGAFAPLRNVTLHFESAADDTAAHIWIERLREAVDSRLSAVSQAPSTMGACLVMLGLGLMLIPMWMVTRHIDDLVDAMSHLFG